MVELLNIDCMEYMKKCPDNYFDLAIVDPPYFKVKGGFDFKWKSFSDYLEDVEKWGKEMFRILKKNGSLFWYGHAKKIAYTQIILDKYFNLENSLVWYKYDSQTNKGIQEFRSFAPVTERILFYSKEIERTGLEEIMLDVNNFKTLRDYFKGLQNFIGLNIKKINERIGNRKSEHAFYWGSTQWDLPTQETYNKIIDVFNILEYKGFREYESLRQEYESLRRPFSNEMNLTDVLVFSQEGHITGQHKHPTQKPPKLTEAIIRTTTRKDSRVFVPFAGSGTELVSCGVIGVDAVGCEIDIDYYQAAKKRIDIETKQQSFF